MTAILEKELTPEIGSMTPRIFTPPLPHHCTGPKADPFVIGGEPEECPCGCGLNPETSWGFACNDFAKYVLKRNLLPYQKWLNIHALEKEDRDGGFRFKILVVLISRQQGKTFWLQQLGLWRLFTSPTGTASRTNPGARLALIAAQNLQYAENVLKEVVDGIRDNDSLAKELVNHRVTNGNHRAILKNRRYWKAATASRKGGRSLSVDIAMLDELREHTTTDAFDAIVPTTLVRPFSQVVCTSNAGDVRSEVLRNLRDPAIRLIQTHDTADTSTGLFEWSVPDDVDPREDKYWHLANPALGNLNNFRLSDLRAMFEAQQYRNLPGFQTEHLCQWVQSLDPGIIPVEHWAETRDKVSRRGTEQPVFAGLDINYERSRSFISIATRRNDGDLHIEVAMANRGTEWIIPWLLERESRGVQPFQGIAVQKTGAPASGMIADLRRAGLPVVEWGPGLEILAGTQSFYDGIVQHKIKHRPSPTLDRAAASGISRNVGDGWVFDRRNSPVDVSPIIACAAAVWLEHQPPEGPPNIHLWPSEQQLQEWEKEADAKFASLEASRPELNASDQTSWWTT